MLFSDNVSLEDEIALKQLGRSKGLLVMGPDCGTAIINGMPLCFANVVRRGPVGVIGASGTGIQEVTCLIDRAGSGVSQAIGAGGRDLKNEQVGGATTLMGVEALAADDETKVIVIISKPPAKAVAEQVVAALERAGKPAVAFFVGATPETRRSGSFVHFAGNLEETAAMAVALAKGKRFAPRAFTAPEAEIEAIVKRETRRVAPSQRYLRGYFTGGTLADEAWIVAHRATGAVHSNNQTDPKFVLADPHISVGHTVVDLGDDAFTVGRPHPMIDPSARVQRMMAERKDRRDRGRRGRRRHRLRFALGSSGSACARRRGDARSGAQARRLSAGSRLDHRDRRRPAELRAAEGEARGGGLRRHALEPPGLRAGDQDSRAN